jgi:hypothetical protein
MADKRLTNEQKQFLVRLLARFLTPTEAAAAFVEEFKIELTRQAAERYDPTKVAGAALKKDLRDLFSKEREAYAADAGAVGLAHKTYRLERLLRLIDAAERMKNISLAAQLIKQAKEEIESAPPAKTNPPNAPAGLSTADHAVLTDPERARRIIDILDAARARRDGQPD